LRLKIVLLACLVTLLTACSKPKLEFVGGHSKLLSDFKGQWLLINYWAVWCKPCVKEIPELNLVNQKAGMTVLAYNFDSNTDDTLDLQMSRLGIQYSALAVDPALMLSQKSPKALPATMLIGPDGEFKTWLMGEQTLGSILAVTN